MPCKNFSHNWVEILKFWPWSEQKSRPYRCFFMHQYCLVLVKGSLEVLFLKKGETERWVKVLSVFGF